MTFAMKLSIPKLMSFMYIMNSTGPSTYPCGTLVTDAQVKADPVVMTLLFFIT